MDDKILSFDDVVLRRSDLDMLSGPYFLNDRIIEFYFSYLSSIHPSQEILLLPPSVSFWITNCPDLESLQGFVDPLKLCDKKLVLFTVNNNDDVNLAEGGSHWSLLAYERNANVFVHHDSSGGMNRKYALQLYKAVHKFVGGAAEKPKYVEHTGSPQQENGYDCGLYVAATTRVICEWSEQCDPEGKDGLWFSAVEEQVTSSVVAAMREEISMLIRRLMTAA